MPNLVNAALMSRKIFPDSVPLTFIVSCREVYDALIDACLFDFPVPGLLKACFGNQDALRSMLALLATCSEVPRKKCFRMSGHDIFTRLLDLYTTVDASLAPYGLGVNIALLAQYEAIRLACFVNIYKLNLFRKLMSLNITVPQLIRILWGRPKYLRAVWALIRIYNNLRVVPNLHIYHMCIFNKPLSENVMAFGQLASANMTCYVSEVNRVSGRFVATGVMAYPNRRVQCMVD